MTRPATTVGGHFERNSRAPMACDVNAAASAYRSWMRESRIAPPAVSVEDAALYAACKGGMGVANPARAPAHVTRTAIRLTECSASLPSSSSSAPNPWWTTLRAVSSPIRWFAVVTLFRPRAISTPAELATASAAFCVSSF